MYNFIQHEIMGNQTQTQTQTQQPFWNIQEYILIPEQGQSNAPLKYCQPSKSFKESIQSRSSSSKP